MTLFRNAAPVAEPVTLSDVKTHLRIDHDREDAYLGDLIAAARESVERRYGLALVEQAWRLVLDACPSDGVVPIALHPLQRIAAVTIYRADGTPLPLDPGRYRLDAQDRPARLVFRAAPTHAEAPNGIEIDLIAGFATTSIDVPASIRRAILILVARFYEFRASFRAEDQPVEWPSGIDALMAPWRPVRL